MAATVLSIESAKQANLNLTEGEKGKHALWQTVVAYQANRRRGTACTKTRNEVQGSGKKLWRQKGTGNARMGSRRSPVWRGGGVVFGPRPRDYSKDINIKTKQLALRTALTARVADGDVLTVRDLSVADGKTKTFAAALAQITDANKILIVGNLDEVTQRAVRNLPYLTFKRSEDVNAEHLLDCAKIILTDHAIETLARRTSTEKK
jgi:large subunit ribosomal protein L4